MLWTSSGIFSLLAPILPFPNAVEVTEERGNFGRSLGRGVGVWRGGKQNHEEYVPGILDGPFSQAAGGWVKAFCKAVAAPSPRSGAGVCGPSQGCQWSTPLVDQGRREETWAKEVQLASLALFKSLFRDF